ncbi:MAG: amino acid racemase [Hyphomonadaceae bacterium]
MRTLGLIGGTSWHSTEIYYRTLNSIINEHFGNNTNPPLRIVNLNQHELHALQSRGDWSTISQIYCSAARDLSSIGCEGILLCANTPHIIFDEVSKASPAKILHIADAAGQRAKQLGLRKLGILGTIYTIRHDLYGKRLRDGCGLETIVADAQDNDRIEQVIKEELTFGIVKEESRDLLNAIISDFRGKGADGVVLACTELSLLTDENSKVVPLLDTTDLHCAMGASFILDEAFS